MMDITTIKKRGRKKKIEIIPEIEPSIQQDIKNTNPSPQIKNPEEVKKRGRKPKVVYTSFGCEAAPEIQFTSDDENIVMKLNLTKEIDELSSHATSQHDEDPGGYDPTMSCAFDCKPLEYVCASDDEKEFDIDTEESPPILGRSTLRVVELLKDFEEKNKNNEWPSSTSIHCYWCCHKFDTPPVGIPVKYSNGKFFVTGCFCSLECATAHNLSGKESIDEIWERNNLTNFLSKTIGYKDMIKPAPNRLALKCFGGHLSIEEFRTFHTTNKLINVNIPPMYALTQQIEEINESDMSSDFKYIPIDNDRINKYKDKIKIKRTKPLNDYKNTLDHAMNLKFTP